MKKERSETLFKRAQQLSPGGVHSPVRAFRGVGGVPRFVERAQGSELVDVDGNRYTDFCLAWGPLILGHQDPEVREAVQQALLRGWSYGAAEPYSLQLAELIHEQIPYVEKIRFVNSGTEAVMSAIRVARGATGRNLILKFDGCYHGHSDSMLVRAGSGLTEMASPDSAGVSMQVASETLVAPLDDVIAFEKVFESRGREIAAVIVEPLPANNGLLIQRDGFLRSVCQIARKHGTLVIFDEVISGFRIGFGGMAQALDIQPDLVTYGKIIGGGFPVGAYGGRADLMDLVAPSGAVYQAGTLSANPVAMVAGYTTLKKLLRDQPFTQLAKKTESLARRVEKASVQSSVPCQVQWMGSIFWFVFGTPCTSDRVVRRIEQIPQVQREVFTRVFHGLLERGFYLAPSAFEVGFMSTVHSDERLDEFGQALEKVLLGQ